LVAVAECGMFNLPNYTPIESAKRAPLWDCFSYLNIKVAKERAEAEAQKK
jgi:hypothetical protein